jgi:hypothetical protein
VVAAKAGRTTPDGYYNVERMLKRVLSANGTVLLCGTCMDARDLDDAALPGGRSLQHDGRVRGGDRNIRPSWLNVFVGSLSQEAYGLCLRSKFSFDFSVIPTAVDIRCDGPKVACDAFDLHLNWLAGFINSQPPPR